MRNSSTLKLVQIVFVLVLITQTSAAQLAKANLDVNDVKALYLADGGMFNDPVVGGQLGYVVPKPLPGEKARTTIVTNALMFGGLDANGTLHTAGMAFRGNGTDFWPGPLNITTGEAHEPANWNRIWKVSKSTIDYHKWNYQNPNYTVPQEILEWPGNGPVGCAPILAPFFDRDGDNLYEPSAGDYPLIKGDQAVYFIYNDNVSSHTGFPGGLPLKIEVHGMAWAISSTNKFIDQTTFLNYVVFNRSTENYYNMKAGAFTNPDIGSSVNDYIATDTLRNMVYCYNSTPFDNGPNGYGSTPPVQAIVFLNKKLESSIAITGDGQLGINSIPIDALQLYRYLRGYWADGTPITSGTLTGRGGPSPTNYIFSGDLCPFSGWVEAQPPGERLTIASINLDTLKAGGSASFDMAFVYARGDSGIITSECKLEQAVDFITTEFNAGALTSVNNTLASNELNVFPNPVTNKSMLKIDNKDGEIFELTISDLQGRIKVNKNIKEDYVLNAEEFISGMYIIRLNSTNHSYFAKFVVK